MSCARAVRSRVEYCHQDLLAYVLSWLYRCLIDVNYTKGSLRMSRYEVVQLNVVVVDVLSIASDFVHVDANCVGERMSNVVSSAFECAENLLSSCCKDTAWLVIYFAARTRQALLLSTHGHRPRLLLMPVQALLFFSRNCPTLCSGNYQAR